MTRLRQTIARRLKDAQNTAAMLTTFNDVDMSAVMSLRSQYKDLFEKRHGVRLGFMGFFVKACIQALREIPAVNAEIDGTDIIYKNYYHIGVAVSTDKGLVVPVVREADRLSLAEIEAQIGDFGRRARDGRLSIDEMQGGTFSITTWPDARSEAARSGSASFLFPLGVTSPPIGCPPSITKRSPVVESLWGISFEEGIGEAP